MGVTIQELEKASTSLKTSVALLQEALLNQPAKIELHKALRDACIQRFEFCVELSWKTCMKILGLETKAPNPAIRDMAQNKLIDERLITYQNTPTTTWWQEPSVIVGGVTVSFCLGALVAYSMTRK